MPQKYTFSNTTIKKIGVNTLFLSYFELYPLKYYSIEKI